MPKGNNSASSTKYLLWEIYFWDEVFKQTKKNLQEFKVSSCQVPHKQYFALINNVEGLGGGACVCYISKSLKICSWVASSEEGI